MIGSMPTLTGFRNGAWAARGPSRANIGILARSSTVMKILLAVLMLFAGAPVSVLHAGCTFRSMVSNRSLRWLRSPQPTNQLGQQFYSDGRA